MPIGAELNASLNSQASLAVLGSLSSSITAGGTTQGTATLIGSANNVVTTVAAGSGVRLPATPTVSASDRLHVANNGANTLACYPPSGGQLSGNTANVPALIAPKKSADFFCIDGTNYTAILSA